ncbi:chemotaxis-specific protein-glutamate methyltransferase CheB [Leptolyngbya cf. ectocarpi LEGE 11479]|uniref:Protein-glutamate methylesterase/protein-glutamine glutaminase n=1 Tax=Leptolyngbya cf. ectocarpi LEGE 11479 TaxID=1828722 RepID=A0A928ZTF9_LEPEC|nr:chemotaxis-specific protein-glutamate methyltransferase CheB [Leptolyngbya ectocarpi]MBE9067286.1 chemotaxis-specific protein-glutamate methyltransferase CheB [Leptolyngbya cf. ectocarpi LEGE 11479]
MSIRVLLVEDSPIAMMVLKRILGSSPDIEVVGTATTGQEGLALIPKIQPDVICTDYFMPHMNGLEFTSHVMMDHPLPILVVSASVQEDDPHRIFQLLEAGAVDILPKPRTGLAPDNVLLKQALINKVKVLSGVKVFKKKRLPSRQTKLQQNNQLIKQPVLPVDGSSKIIAVGASTGGPLALQQLFMGLPKGFPSPIICVQHISQGFLQGLIDWLRSTCNVAIEIAQAGQRPEAGKIYFPSERQHLTIDARGRFTYADRLSDEIHCPSVDTLFLSIAEFYGRRTIGILLSGMGRDGADGMKAIADAGGLTIAQDEKTSVVFGMPKAAIDLGAAQQVLPMDAIAPAIITLVNRVNQQTT